MEFKNYEELLKFAGDDSLHYLSIITTKEQLCNCGKTINQHEKVCYSFRLTKDFGQGNKNYLCHDCTNALLTKTYKRHKDIVKIFKGNIIIKNKEKSNEKFTFTFAE